MFHLVPRRVSRTGWSLLFGLSLALSVSREARAEHSAEENVRLDEMDMLLARYEGEASRYRVWNGVAGAALGASSLAAGGFVLGREMAVPGFIMVVRGGLSLGSSALDLFGYETPFEELRRHFAERRASSMKTGEIFDATEAEWAAMARRVRAARVRSGVLSLALGGLLVSLGTAAAIWNLGIPSEELGTTERASFAGLISSVGGATMSAGVRALLVDEPIEAGWRTYAQAPLRVSSFRIQVAPLRGGTYVGLSAAF